MKADSLKLSEYTEKFGVNPTQARGRIAEDVFALWQRAKALPITEVLVIHPEKQDGDAAKLRKRLWTATKKLVAAVNFELKFAINKHENHVVVYKLAKAAK